MPVPTDITAGTITITNGSKAVTGVGTGWLASDIRRGDLFIWIEGGDGFWQPIVASVESNTALTLEEEWEGPTLSGAPYRLRYQWDSSRVSAQARQLIDVLGDGKLQSLAGLSASADTLPYFDGPGSMALADFPAWARALFAETGQLPNAALPERIRASSPRLDQPSDDLNDISESGFFVTADGVVGNRPLGTGEWFIYSIVDDSAGAGARTQIAVRRTTAGGGLAFRHRDTSGVWQDWKIVYHNQNSVGAVSQSGGTPTGAIIERGENANGEYVRFADGTMKCWGVVSITPVANEVSTAVATFPASFASGPSVVVSTVSNSAAVVRTAALNSQATPTNVTVNFIRSNTGTTMQNYEASGRWF